MWRIGSQQRKALTLDEIDVLEAEDLGSVSRVGTPIGGKNQRTEGGFVISRRFVYDSRIFAFTSELSPAKINQYI